MTAQRARLADYLLQRLPADEAARITERLFGEEEFASEMEEVERDLLDAYAQEKLSAAERTEVETCLMTSETQREKLRLAQALARSKKTAGSALPSSYYRLAAALTVLGAALLVQNRHLQMQIASLRAGEAHAVDSAAVSFLLNPVERGENAEALRVSGNATLVRLDFSLGSAADSAVDVRIVQESGQLVYQQNGLPTRARAGAYFVSTWLPVATLVPGNYSATVGRGLNFAFRVVQ